MKSSVTIPSIKKAKKKLIEWFGHVGIRKDEGDDLSLATTDLQYVRNLGRELAFWASDPRRTSAELESMMRVCNSSLVDLASNFVFKPYWNEALEIIEIGVFDKKASGFVSDSMLKFSRYPYDVSIIKMFGSVADSEYVEYLDRAEVGFFDNDPTYDCRVGDLDPLVVKIRIVFMIEFDTATDQLHYWLQKTGTQVNHTEVDYSKFIATRINQLNEYYSEWVDGMECNARTRFICGGRDVSEGGDEYFEF